MRLANGEELEKGNRNLYLNKAFNIVTAQKNDSIARVYLLEISTAFFNDNNWRDFKKSTNVLLEKAIESKDTFNIAQVYRYKAGYYRLISVNDSAFIYYLKAEKLFRLINNKSELGTLLSYKSAVQFNIGDYVGADRSLTQAYKTLKNQKENEKLVNVFTMMGIVSNETKVFNKALDYYSKALKIIKEGKLTNNYQEAICLNNIGYVYQNKGDFAEAIKNYKLALTDTTIVKNQPELYSLLIDNLAYSKFKLKDYQGLPKLFYESLKIREQLKVSTLIVLSKVHLSEYYFAINEISLSEKFAQEALILAKVNGISRDFLVALKQSSNVDHINATQYTQDYIRINDSIQAVERNSQEKFARLQLETDEIIEQKDILEEKNRTLLYFFVVTTILIGFLVIIRAQRFKTRELVLKQAQQKANEDIYNMMISQQTVIDESRAIEKKRIARELHDGVLGRMFGARLNLDSLNSNSDEQSVKKRFEYLFELKNIEQDIREISHDLNREKSVLINNFVSIVNNLLEEQRVSFDAKVITNIDLSVNWDIVNNTVKINLYRIIQEGLQNINKYAKANTINVSINGNKEAVFLVLEDDGIGFEVNKKSKGIGLQNMISRTQECEGIIDIKSNKGKGTAITITIPIVKKQKPIEQE
jgi:signal transduction histidine kinase